MARSVAPIHRCIVFRRLHRLQIGIPRMTSIDIALFCGQLVSAWAAGFTGGFIITRFKEAMSHAT